MPTTIFKCTLFFEMGKYGWSESYALQRQDSSYVFAMARLKELATFRAGIMAAQPSIVGQRVSDFKVNGDGQPDDQIYYGSLGAAANDPFTAVLGLFLNSARTGRKPIYWRGVPDDVSQNGGVYVPGAVLGFQSNMRNFINYLLTPQTDATWGWWGRPSPKPLPVLLSNYTIDPTTGKVTLLFNANIFAAVPVGSRVSVFLSGINAPSKSALNGTQVVTVVSPNSAFLSRPISVFPFNSGGQGTYAGSVFQAFNSGKDLRVTERKAGRNFFVERGRHAVRPRG